MTEQDAAKILADGLKESAREYVRTQPEDRPKRADEVWMSAWMTLVRSGNGIDAAANGADLLLSDFKLRFGVR